MHRKKILEKGALALDSNNNSLSKKDTPLSFLPVGTLHQSTMIIRLPDSTVVEFTGVPSPEHVCACISALRSGVIAEDIRLC
jgi:hypothetical protein